MKRKLDVYRDHLQVTYPSLSSEKDGRILFAYIRKYGSSDDPDSVIEILKNMGIREDMDKEEIAQTLKEFYESNVINISLSRSFMNVLIGLCEDEYSEEKTATAKDKPKSLADKIRNIFRFLLGKTSKKD